MAKAKDNGPKQPQLICDNKSPSGLPRSYLISPSTNSATKFCKAVDKQREKKLTWNVSANGDQKKGKRDFLILILKKPDLSSKWNLELMWEPKPGSKKCSASCIDAFETMFLEKCEGE